MDLQNRMRKILIVALLAIVAGLSSAQTADHATEGFDSKVLATIEVSLANRFVALRKAAGEKRLVRIKDRSDLRQRLCTAASGPSTSKSWGTSSGIREVYYETDNPESLDSRFQQMAESRPPPKQAVSDLTPTPERFAVAVWPSKAQGKYWVGVGTYWSAWGEWFDLHLTDDASYSKGWDKIIAPECKQVK
jgi:hypothetical protein